MESAVVRHEFSESFNARLQNERAIAKNHKEVRAVIEQQMVHPDYQDAECVRQALLHIKTLCDAVNAEFEKALKANLFNRAAYADRSDVQASDLLISAQIELLQRFEKCDREILGNAAKAEIGELDLPDSLHQSLNASIANDSAFKHHLFRSVR